jgi:hypothetical protein
MLLLRDPVYQFSYQRGFLLLPDTLKEKHGVKKQIIVLHTDDICFGNRFSISKTGNL